MNPLRFLTHTDIVCEVCGCEFPHFIGPWGQPTICPACEIDRQEKAEIEDEENKTP